MSYLILSAEKFWGWDMFGGKALVLELKLNFTKFQSCFSSGHFLAISVGNASNTPSLAFHGLIFSNSAFERCKYHSSGGLNPGCRD